MSRNKMKITRYAPAVVHVVTDESDPNVIRAAVLAETGWQDTRFVNYYWSRDGRKREFIRVYDRR